MTTKAKKFKTAGIATLLAGLTIIGGIAYHEYSDSYESRLKKEISHMSVEQLEEAIRECDTALTRLQKTIDSKETNPEERFEANQAYESISKHRVEYQKRLDKIMKKQGTTINFRDAVKSR
jgi:hypothetical protein